MVGCGWNAGRRHGWARTALLEILIGSAVPMTASDVHAQLKVRYPGPLVPYATVKSGLG
jgi:Fe2+ or Zn2+ uptake regulation protein